MSRAPLAELPFWPRFLSLEEAARYVGVSPAVFAEEVKEGLWPQPLRRGSRGGRLTWDRIALDQWADRASSAKEGVAEPAATGPAYSDQSAAYWMEKIDATSDRNRVARKARSSR